MLSRNARGRDRVAGLALVVCLGVHADVARAQQRQALPPAATRVADTARPAKPAPAISRDSARVLLIARIAGATVVSQRLMLKDGRQIYSFRVREKGKPATARVIVDATTGEVKR